MVPVFNQLILPNLRLKLMKSTFYSNVYLFKRYLGLFLFALKPYKYFALELLRVKLKFEYFITVDTWMSCYYRAQYIRSLVLKMDLQIGHCWINSDDFNVMSSSYSIINVQLKRFN